MSPALLSHNIEVEDFEQVVETFYQKGWTDSSCKNRRKPADCVIDHYGEKLLCLNKALSGRPVKPTAFWSV